MAGQPLAWMEAIGLPKDAFTTQKLVAQYQKIQLNFHKDVILPMGDEPSGNSWTGFQSIGQNEGYVLIFGKITKIQVLE